MGLLGLVGMPHKAQSFMAFAATNEDTQTFDFQDTLTFQAMTQHDPDQPSYVDTLAGPYSEGFFEDMQNDIEQLKSKKFWTLI